MLARDLKVPGKLAVLGYIGCRGEPVEKFDTQQAGAFEAGLRAVIQHIVECLAQRVFLKPETRRRFRGEGKFGACRIIKHTVDVADGAPGNAVLIDGRPA